jgi:peptide/nickel transport system permease protein
VSLGVFCVRRFFQSIAIFLGVSSILFLLFYVVGGDPSLVFAGKNADIKTIEFLRQQMGLDQPVYLQFIKFITDSVVFDWGTSWSTQRSVKAMIWEGVGPSLAITVIGFIVTVVFALVLAFLSHNWMNKKREKIILFSVSCLMSVSSISIILFMQKLFSFELNMFPVFGWESGWGSVHFVILPIMIYVVGTFSPKFLLFRSVIFEEAKKRYILTAQSKGLSWLRIYTVHILKNLWPLLTTIVAIQIPTLLTHALLLEIYFGIPGLGHLLLTSIQGGDFPVVKALTLLGASIYILGLFVADVLVQYFFPQEKSL